MTGRDVVLQRVRAAVSGSRPLVPREYRHLGEHPPGSDEVVELLIDRLVDYRATVRAVPAVDLAAAVRETLTGLRSVAVPPGLPGEISAASVDLELFVDGRPDILPAQQLDRIDAVVTCARVACAVTGTIFLDGSPDQGRRALTLVPDRHVVVLRTDQVVETIPEALERMSPTAPITMISGPSATSDIELSRVEGVHGPRTLIVLVVR